MVSTLLFALLAAVPAHAYYGRNSTEALLTFSATADVKFSRNVRLAELLEDGPARREALARIDEQVQHLMGSFQADSFRNEFGYPGALGERYEIRFTEVSDGSARGRKLLRYRFRGEVVFQKDAFHGRDTRGVLVKLPLAPDLIYALGIVRDRNRCTDRDFSEPEDFWYYWDPDKPGCPLAGNDTEVLRLRGNLERIPNTKLSYPEYDRLYGDNGNGRNLDVAVFIGYIRNQDTDAGKPARGDEAMRAFRTVDRALSDDGFELREKINHFKLAPDGSQVDGINYLRRYTREITTSDGRTVKARVFVLLADTDIDSKDDTFHHYVVPALRAADLFVYDGHSNLGKNFDLNRLPGVSFDPDKYQIIFFNGCSTYPYLNGSYFRAKGGTRNLEVLTAGLPALADASGPNLLTFLKPFLSGKTISYQRILSELEASNGDGGTFLVGVKGDEDNEWMPERSSRAMSQEPLW